MGRTETLFTEAPPTTPLRLLLDSVVRVRSDLYVDPMVADPWQCNPDRCAPRLGPNLCCKVEKRCPHLRGKRCAIQERKPFLCALFPLDLVRIGTARLITTPKNLDFFLTGWSRYHRDMLRCFDGHLTAASSMFQEQKPVLARCFTQGELRSVEKALAETMGMSFSAGV